MCRLYEQCGSVRFVVQDKTRNYVTVMQSVILIALPSRCVILVNRLTG